LFDLTSSSPLSIGTAPPTIGLLRFMAIVPPVVMTTTFFNALLLLQSIEF